MPDAANRLVAEAEADARTRDEAYAERIDPRRRSLTLFALAAALPALALAAVWSTRASRARTLPPPAVEAVDLARTLRLAIAEVEDFRSRHGRLPVAAEAAAFLPEGARLTLGEGDGYELRIPAPVVGELWFRSDEDPDGWLAVHRAALEAEAGR